jgi:hypothetical protein
MYILQTYMYIIHTYLCLPAGFINDALANERWRGPKSRAPYKTTGVKYLSPLAALDFFDLVWDILGDLMHQIPGIWKRHIFAMFQGLRVPAKPKPRKTWTPEQNQQLEDAWNGAKEILKSWEVSKSVQKTVDLRSMALGGHRGWVRNNIQVFEHASHLLHHDWFLLIQSAGDYLLEGILDNADNMNCLYALAEVCSLCMSAESAHDSENRAVIDTIKTQLIRALVVVEARFPPTELCSMFHVLMHIPDSIYRWNSARNFWSFFGERYVFICVHIYFNIYVYA